MIDTCVCGYCGTQLGTLHNLEEHFVNVREHPVFSCCGSFFRHREHYAQHKASPGILDHHDTCVRGEEA